MSAHHSAFQAVQGPAPWYWFRAQADSDWLWDPQPARRLFNQVVVYSHSTKERCFRVDLYCGLLPSWNRQFGRHLLANSTGLPNLRLGSRAISFEEAIYRHDGSELNASAVLEHIAGELGTHALPWFRSAEEAAGRNILVQTARAWLREHWAEIADDVAERMADAIRAANHQAWNVDFPLLQNLKDDLRAVASARDLPASDRQEISTLAHDLLEYAQYRKRGGAT